MGLSDINNRESILRAVAEFDQTGRASFLKKYGFGEARSYFLFYEGKKYDSKAIIGAAHNFEFNSQLMSKDFSGGELTVKRKLEELGFSVINKYSNPNVISFEDIKPGIAISNTQLMEFFNVGQQGGMRRNIKRNHLVVISDHTKSLYEDRWVGNVIHYTGMGKSGDQTLTSQNRTLNDSSSSNIKVYLFEVMKPKIYVFHGEALLAEKPYQETQLDDGGELRKVWMFPLKLMAKNYHPLASRNDIESVRKARERALKGLTLEQIRKRAKNSKPNPTRRQVNSVQIIRNESVAVYVKLIADGKCDLCEENAPFVGKDNEPFLECHHVNPLAKGGADVIENAVALCPNCHRKMHSLNLQTDIKKLLRRIKIREARF